MQNQCGHANMQRPMRTGRAVIIVVRTTEAGVAGSDLVVKLAQGRNSLQPFSGIVGGKELRRAPAARPSPPPNVAGGGTLPRRPPAAPSACGWLSPANDNGKAHSLHRV